MAQLTDPYAFPPRGLDRAQAARWVGVGTTKFDELVAAGNMPKPKRIGGRVVWDRYQVDLAFNDLPSDTNRIDSALAA